MLVTPTVAICIFLAVVAISAIVGWWMRTYENFDKSSFHSFIVILTGLGIIITFMFYYNLVQLQVQQQELDAIAEITRVNASFLTNVLNGINEASTKIPSFTSSLTPLHVGSTGSIPPDPVTPETTALKMTLSYRIFSLWNDMILSKRFLDHDAHSYICNFLQKANSTQLYEQWLLHRINFPIRVQTFGNLLFEHALPITEHVPESYTAAAKALMACHQYKSVFS